MDLQQLFDKLGLRGSKWQWRAMRWERALSSFWSKMTGKGKQITYQHKLCPECGALVAQEDTACSRCGSSVDSWQAQVATRAFVQLLPGGQPATSALLVSNVLLFGFMLTKYGMGQILSPGFIPLCRMGALTSLPVLGGEFWRFIAHGYLHIGIIHLLFNMVVLQQLGPMLEREIGSSRFFVLYTLSLLGGGMAIALGGPVTITAGASGALFGCVGFGAAYGHAYGGAQGRAMRNVFLRWIIYATLFGVVIGHVSHRAHFGGLAVGALLGFLLEREHRSALRLNLLWMWAARLCLLVTLLAFVWMIVERGGVMHHELLMLLSE